MLYSVFSYDDGTEVTASKPDENGTVELYVEKFDEKQDSFINATILMPEMTIKSSFGYDEKELINMLDAFSSVKEDILEYVREKTKIDSYL